MNSLRVVNVRYIRYRRFLICLKILICFFVLGFWNMGVCILGLILLRSFDSSGWEQPPGRSESWGRLTNVMDHSL